MANQALLRAVGVFASDSAGGVVFKEATGLDAKAIADVQECYRFGSTLNPHLHFHCVIIACAGGCCAPSCSAALLPTDAARAMAQWAHGGGFRWTARCASRPTTARGVRERLLRYCARPPFALERLHEVDAERLRYDSAKPGTGGERALLLTAWN